MSSQAQPASGSARRVSVERREAERHLCCRECTARPKSATGVGNWAGIIYNISTVGIGVALPYPVQPGMDLVIDPWGWTGGKPLHARVVRAVPLAFLFLHGCEFAEPLPEETLQALLP